MELLGGERCTTNNADLSQAADFLEIKDLLDACYQCVADQINKSSVQQIRKTFDIRNDLTYKDEVQFNRESEWTTDNNVVIAKASYLDSNKYYKVVRDADGDLHLTERQTYHLLNAPYVHNILEDSDDIKENRALYRAPFIRDFRVTDKAAKDRLKVVFILRDDGERRAVWFSALAVAMGSWQKAKSMVENAINEHYSQTCTLANIPDTTFYPIVEKVWARGI